jgi:hypothetical protein
LERAGEKRQGRSTQLATARDRQKAAKQVLTRSRLETDEQYLRRLSEYADTHNLPLIKSRAEKLLAAKPADTAKGYYPRDFDDRIAKQLGTDAAKAGGQRFARGGNRSVARITAGYQRADKRRLGAVNAEREAAGQVPFSTNIETTVLNHVKQVARAVSQGEFHKELAGLGRPVKFRRDADGKVLQPKLADGEGIYHLGFGGSEKKFGLHPVDAVPNTAKSGQYVVLDKALTDEMQAGIDPFRLADHIPGVETTTSDGRAQAPDDGDARLPRAQHAQRHGAVLPCHAGPQAAGQHEAGFTGARRSQQQAKTWRPEPSGKTIKVAGETVPLDDFLKTARKEGVLDSGWIGRELGDLGGEGAERTGKVKTGPVRRAGRAIDRTMTSRENMVRLATFKAGLDKGLSTADAATVAKKLHVDYDDLTASSANCFAASSRSTRGRRACSRSPPKP